MSIDKNDDQIVQNPDEPEQNGSVNENATQKPTDQVEKEEDIPEDLDKFVRGMITDSHDEEIGLEAQENPGIANQKNQKLEDDESTSMSGDDQLADSNEDNPDKNETPYTNGNDPEAWSQKGAVDNPKTINIYNIKDQGRDRERETSTITTPIHRSELRRAKQIFVPSDDYQNKVSTLREPNHRLIMIYGRRNAGKYTTANCLAQEIAPRASIYQIQRFATPQPWSLMDFINSDEFEENAVYILEEGFEHPHYYEVLTQFQNRAQRKLGQLNSWIILTTRRKPEELDALEFDRVNAEATRIQAIYEKHLDYYSLNLDILGLDEDVIMLAKLQWEKVKAYLTNPDGIKRFCLKLGEVPADLVTEHSILDLAKETGRLSREPAKKWFHGLPTLNHRFYAMLVILFESLDRRLLEDIYHHAVQDLRQDGVEALLDPREIGLDEILEHLYCSELNGFVRFDDNVYRLEAKRQILNNYHLLGAVFKIMHTLITKYITREYVELRRSLGQAIGNLGPFHRAKYNNQLKKLAQNENASIVGVAGFALAETIKDPKYGSLVFEMLRNWTDSGDLDLIWAAIDSLWRVYESLSQMSNPFDSDEEEIEDCRRLKERCLDLFEVLCNHPPAIKDAYREQLRSNLAERYPSHQLDAIYIINVNGKVLDIMKARMFALSQMIFSDGSLLVKRLRTWFENEKLNYVLPLFIDWFFPNIGTFKSEPAVPCKYIPLLDLATPVLSGDMEKTTIDTYLKAWLPWLEWETWYEHISRTMFTLINRAPSETLSNLVTGITRNWMGSNCEKAKKLGQKIITRGTALQGHPIFLREQATAILALGLFERSEGRALVKKMARVLFQLLSACIDMKLLRLGRTSPIEDHLFLHDDDYQDSKRPPLLWPAIKVETGVEIALILVPTWEPIIDLEDARHTQWEKTILLATPNEDWAPEWVYPLAIPEDNLNQVLFKLLERAHYQLFRYLADQDLSKWRIHFSEKENKTNFYESFETCIQALEQLEPKEGQEDPARELATRFLLFISESLEASIELTLSWLEIEGNSLKRHMARAFAIQVFRICTHREPANLPHDLLARLGRATVDLDWQAAYSLLLAWRHWLSRDEDWARDCLADSGELHRRWEDFAWHLAAAYPHKMLETLGQWEVLLEGEEQISEHILTAGQRLLWYHTMSQTRNMTLTFDKPFGLIILDSRFTVARDEKKDFRIFNFILKSMLETWPDLPLIIFRMGHEGIVNIIRDCDQDLHEIGNPIDKPRLCYPILEKCSVKQAAFGFVLSLGTIVDASDWRRDPWEGKLWICGESRGVPHWVRRIHPKHSDRILNEIQPIMASRS